MESKSYATEEIFIVLQRLYHYMKISPFFYWKANQNEIATIFFTILKIIA